MNEYYYISTVCIVPLDELIFKDGFCNPFNIHKPSHKQLGVFVGDTALHDVHKAVQDYLDETYKDKCRGDQFLGNDLDVVSYQYGWKDARAGIKPAHVERYKVSELELV